MSRRQRPSSAASCACAGRMVYTHFRTDRTRPGHCPRSRSSFARHRLRFALHSRTPAVTPPEPSVKVTGSRGTITDGWGERCERPMAWESFASPSKHSTSAPSRGRISGGEPPVIAGPASAVRRHGAVPPAGRQARHVGRSRSSHVPRFWRRGATARGAGSPLVRELMLHVASPQQAALDAQVQRHHG